MTVIIDSSARLGSFRFLYLRKPNRTEKSVKKIKTSFVIFLLFETIRVW